MLSVLQTFEHVRLKFNFITNKHPGVMNNNKKTVSGRFRSSILPVFDYRFRFFSRGLCALRDVFPHDIIVVSIIVLTMTQMHSVIEC